MKIYEKNIENLKEKLSPDKLQSLSLLAGFDLTETQFIDRLTKLEFTSEEIKKVLSTITETASTAPKDYSHLNSTVQEFYRPSDGWNEALIEDVEIVDNQFEEGKKQFKFTFIFSGHKIPIYTTMYRSNRDSRFNRLIGAFIRKDEKMDFNKIIGKKVKVFCVTVVDSDGKSKTKYEKFERIAE